MDQIGKEELKEITPQKRNRGHFLAELRKEKGLTQEEVGQILNYTNTAVSKWERNLSFPTDPDVLNNIAQFYGVSLEELMYGERKDSKNSQLIQENFVNEYNNNYHKYKKNLFRYHNILLISIIIFLIIIYFIFIRNSIKLYSIDFEDSHIKITNSTLIISNKINILNFNSIVELDDKKIQNVEMYYLDSSNNKVKIFYGGNKDRYIEEKHGYNEYHLQELISNQLYLEIQYDDEEIDKIELELTQKYTNDNIFPKNVGEISNESDISSEASDLESKLKSENFVFIDDSYEKKIKDDIIIRIYPDISKIKLDLKIKNQYYFLDSNIESPNINCEELTSSGDSKYDILNETESKNCEKEECKTINDYAKYINYLKETLK